MTLASLVKFLRAGGKKTDITTQNTATLELLQQLTLLPDQEIIGLRRNAMVPEDSAEKAALAIGSHYEGQIDYYQLLMDMMQCDIQEVIATVDHPKFDISTITFGENTLLHAVPKALGNFKKFGFPITEGEIDHLLHIAEILLYCDSATEMIGHPNIHEESFRSLFAQYSDDPQIGDNIRYTWIMDRFIDTDNSASLLGMSDA